MLRFLVILFFCSLNSNAQGFSSIGTKVDLYPAFSKVENLANQIDNDFESDEEKAQHEDMYIAVKDAFDIAQRKIRKIHEKRHDLKRRAGAAATPEIAE